MLRNNTQKVVVIACAALLLIVLSGGLTLACTGAPSDGHTGGLQDGSKADRLRVLGFRSAEQDSKEADRALRVAGFRSDRLVVTTSGAVKSGEVRSACPGYTRIEPAWTVGAPPGLMLVRCPGGVRGRAR